ncbi:substrate-binding periplasmic protein [Martelella alba]|uniref:Transporter substrate-binding domain-containing protein n=1 Tax=Martelella alba TaxID=2590451 RepID=A0ABY2SPE0_9HYPH|nr:transporter substrate-binding domain-containing protein [Martelella alba]TKI07016.1 transporter substrate-binding domain-containing protein [Martelella alba]
MYFTQVLRRQPLICCLFLTSLFLPALARAEGTNDLWKQVKERGVLRCGTAVTPPYIIRDPLTQKYGGPFVQLCKDFANNVLHVKAELVNTSWDNMVAGIQANRWDLGMSLSQTPEREKSIAFSSPVIYSSVTFSYAKNNPKLTAPAKIADFDKPNVTIAVMSGSIADTACSKIFTKAHIMRLPGSQEATMALLSHRADVYADDIGTNMIVVAAHAKDLAVFKPDPPLQSLPAGFGLRKDTSKEDLDILNKFVIDMRQSGAVDKMLKEAVDKSLK